MMWPHNRLPAGLILWDEEASACGQTADAPSQSGRHIQEGSRNVKQAIQIQSIRPSLSLLCRVTQQFHLNHGEMAAVLQCHEVTQSER